MNIKILIAAALLLIPLNAHAGPEFSEEFHAFLAEETLKIKDNTPVFDDDISKFYEARKYRPVWHNNKGKFDAREARKFERAIFNHAVDNGLEPADYNIDDVIKANIDPFEKEWMMTNLVMHYINDLKTGRIDPHKYDPMLFLLPQKITLTSHAKSLLKNANDAYGTLDKLAPPHPEYAALRKNLKRYREIKLEGGWPKVNIANSTIIYPGESHKDVPSIRERLAAAYHDYDGKLPEGIWIDKGQIAAEKLNDLIIHQDEATDIKDERLADQNPDWIYEPKLAKRVAEFQYFHGIKADGVIGPETTRKLNEPVEKQIDKIKLAMERWRWLPDDLGDKHIRVNIAAFHARAVENGRDEFVMPIIVGKVAHQTPIFSSVIKNVKIHPDWTSPNSIAARYVIPKIQKNPAVIHKLGYQLQEKQTGKIVSWKQVNIDHLHKIDLATYQFRQKPGVRNALGLARFSIENDFAIFMHGTPSVSLFKEEDRTFSSGCIRLENPLVMAHFLLHDQGMPLEELEDLYFLDEGEFPDTTYIDLDKDVPVHLMYGTAWVDQEGHLHFAEDVYRRDEKLKEAFTRMI